MNTTAYMATIADFECAGILPRDWAPAARDANATDYATWRARWCHQPRGMSNDYFDMSAQVCYENGPFSWWLACRTN